MAFKSLIRLSSMKSPIYNSLNPLIQPNSKIKTFLETSHLQSDQEKSFIESQFSALNPSNLPIAQRLNSLSMLQMEESLDEFLHKKFGNFKRYSCEGTESIHPCLYSAFQEYHSSTPSSIILTVPHRGKLSIITSVLKYPLRLVFAKIEGRSLIPPGLNENSYYFTDDLVFCRVFSVERPEFPGLKLILPHNSCHLELGGSVGMGKTRAKIDSGLPSMHIWVHGDASVSGQGVVYETTQLSQLHKFQVNGTLHIIENNQIGFTANEESERSSTYCTDVFKIIGAPIIHVNSNSIDDVVKAVILGVRYRKKFKNDFVIDLVGYRKYGHNELDDPTITNPLMYKSIKKLGVSVDEYAEKLIAEGIVSKEYIGKLKNLFWKHLEDELAASRDKRIIEDIKKYFWDNNFQGKWKICGPIHSNQKLKTGVKLEVLEEILQQSLNVPENFNLHAAVKRTFKQRVENFSEKKIDWALAEVLAFGSLLKGGHNIRLSGEDVVRGTFSQRHVGVYCQDTNNQYFPLSALRPGKLTVVNSPVTELGVLGFEYGYSLDDPKNLTIWESQFGDFANMAQSIIDTYICSGESKTARQSGLVMLLPHGQEGQGPEHSSAQLERYLSLVNDPLSSQVNIDIVNLVFPSNYFHVLRRSLYRDFRRPLIILTPKSGLRNKLSYSHLQEFDESEKFKPIIMVNKGEGSKNLFVCSGKVYLDLIQRFENISLMVIEQLCPIPSDEIRQEVKQSGKSIVWVQEESENFGAWNYFKDFFVDVSGKVGVIARPKVSTQGVGSLIEFTEHQENIIKRVKELGAS